MKTINIKGGKVAIIDDEDFGRVNKLKWTMGTYGYAQGYIIINKKNSTIRLHRFILGLKNGDKKIVDHINRNKLDNRKENLRFCSRTQNSKNYVLPKTNTSGFKGVTWQKGFKWRAQIYCDNKNYHLGSFDNKIDAAKAYNEAAKKYHREFACLNKV